MISTSGIDAIPFIPSDSTIPPIIIAVALLVFFIITLFFVLPWLSESISYLGIYHRLSNDKYAGEPFRVKCKRVGKVYAQISVPLIISYLLFLHTLNVQFEIVSALMITSLTMGTLFIIRVHGNPSQDLIEFKKEFPSEVQKNIIEQHRERILSFLFSLISAQLIFAIIATGFIIGRNPRFTFSVEPFTILIFVLAFITGLFIITLAGEKYLIWRPPCHQLTPLIQQTVQQTLPGDPPKIQS